MQTQRVLYVQANACEEVVALALKSMEEHAGNEHVVQAAQKLAKLLAS